MTQYPSPWEIFPTDVTSPTPTQQTGKRSITPVEKNPSEKTLPGSDHEKKQAKPALDLQGY